MYEPSYEKRGEYSLRISGSVTTRRVCPVTSIETMYSGPSQSDRNVTLPPTYSAVSPGSARTRAGAPGRTVKYKSTDWPLGATMTTFPVAAYCFASTQTDACPLASVSTGRRSITKPGSSIGATSTKPLVLKYTVWPDIGWRLPSRRTTVSGGLKVESTVSDNPAPDTIFSPARGPIVSPHA